MSDGILEVDMQSTLNSVIKYLDDFMEDQLPFALAGALFACGLDAKAEMTKRLFDKFTIRTGTFGGKQPWAARALYVSPEKVKDIRGQMKSGKASITVASRSKVLGPMLSDGGVRKKKDGSDFAVPILGGGRKNKMTVIANDRIAKRTGKLRMGNTADLVIDRKNGFMLPLKNGNGQLLLTRKKAWKDGGRTKAALQAMFYMKNQVRIKPWWKPRDILAACMEAKLPEHFVRKYNDAIRTRK